MSCVSPEDNVPVCWDDDIPMSKRYIIANYNYISFLAPIGKCFTQLLVIQAFRPDRLLAMASNFVSSVMGKEFLIVAEQELDLATIVNEEVLLIECNCLPYLSLPDQMPHPYSIMFSTRL